MENVKKKYKQIPVKDVEKYLGVKVLIDLALFEDSLSRNNIGFDFKSNASEDSVSVCIGPYAVVYLKGDSSYFLDDTFVELDIDPEDYSIKTNSLPTKLAEILNKNKYKIELRSCYKDISFKEVNKSVRVDSGVLPFYVVVPVIEVSTVEIDGQDEEKHTAEIGLFIGSKKSISVDKESLSDVGIAFDGLLFITQLISDFTQKTIKLISVAGFIRVQPKSIDTVKSSFNITTEPKEMRRSNRF